jgi:alkanesulfonate monooxygenase SsuD/methylene tetrahydromethanopterin reductase-like flavin-dependent oxidoreductase (luciferase family)
VKEIEKDPVNNPIIEPFFGLNINPQADRIDTAFDIARLADDFNIDLIGVQDHPYNSHFLDAWTLLSSLGIVTKKVHIMTNVANLPLRPPTMLAKAASTLDILTKGRMELGIGAGAFWDAIKSYGGSVRTPKEAVGALEEAIKIIRLIWQPTSAKKEIFRGKYYRLEGARVGPAPCHTVRIWVGALGPHMLNLTGRLADGWSISHQYVTPERVLGMQKIIDEAATLSGRRRQDIRRGYNLSGVIVDEEKERAFQEARKDGVLVGNIEEWAEMLTQFYRDLRLDTFIFWPAFRENEVEQTRIFAEKVVPKARKSIKAALATEAVS